jgi:putative MATE family efflux protein
MTKSDADSALTQRKEGFFFSQGTFGIFEGPILSTLIRLSVPIYLGLMSQLLYYIADTIWISRIDLSDPSYVGGVGIIFPLLFGAIAISSGMLIGVGSLVARSIGAGDRKTLSCVAESGLVIAGAISALVTFLCYLYAEQIVFLLGARGDYSVHALEYLRFILPAAGMMIVGNVFLGLLQGAGQMRGVMIAMIITTSVNIVLDPVCIFLLDMNVKGAGIATVIAQAITALYLVPIFLKKKTLVQVEWKWSNIDFVTMKKIVAVGFPQTAGHMFLAVNFLFFNRIVVSIDQLALTAFSICGRFDQVLLLPLLAIAAAVITMTGQNFGRKKYMRVEGIWKTGILLGMAVIACIAGTIVIFAPRLFAFFTTIERVVDYSVLQTRLVQFSFVLAVIADIGRACFQAVGKPIPGLIITMLRLALIPLPTAFVLVYGFGAGMYGVWYGIILGNLFSAVASYVWIKLFLRRKITRYSRSVRLS